MADLQDVQIPSGVDPVPAAGEQDDFDLEKLLFGDETGAKEEDAAGLQDEGQKSSEVILPEDASKAFARKWSESKDKLREEILSEIKKTMQPQQRYPDKRDLSAEEIAELSERLEAPESVVRILHQMQQKQDALFEASRRRDHEDNERMEYAEAREYVDTLRKSNTLMPEFDPQKVYEYRLKHYEKTKANIPWKTAYQLMVADMVEKGDIVRGAEQKTIKQIQGREQSTSAGVKAPATKKMSIDDLSKEEFKKYVEDAKAGRYSAKK